jgi:hypothetical protein
MAMGPGPLPHYHEHINKPHRFFLSQISPGALNLAGGWLLLGKETSRSPEARITGSTRPGPLYVAEGGRPSLRLEREPERRSKQ